MEFIDQADRTGEAYAEGSRGRDVAGPLPKVILITGFLGSGKTSLILQVAEQLSREGLRLAVVENEIGEVGVDGRLLKRRGLVLKEIYAGCVCCQISGDLVAGIRALREEYSPDVILIEASGVAEPQPILATLSKYCPELDPVSVTVVDAERVRLYLKVLPHLVEAQIRGADILVLNKVDLVDAHETRDLVLLLYETNKRSLILVTHTTGGLKPWTGNLFRGVVPPATPYAFSVELSYQGHQDARGLCDLLRAFMVEAALECVVSGVSIIGHLKVYLEDERGEFVHGSLTSLSMCNVKASEGVMPPTVFKGVGNLIAYGADEEQLRKCTEHAALRSPGVRVGGLEADGCHDREPHHNERQHL